MTDPRPLFFRALATGGDVVAAVRPEQLESPTPCSEFDVATLLDHLVMVAERTAAMGRGEPPMAVQPAHRDSGWADAWRAAVDDNEAAWAGDAALDRKVTLPWTEMTGAEVLQMYTSEVTVHTWDVAAATGQRPAWDDAVLATALSAMERDLPAVGRKEMIEQAMKNLPPGMPATFPFAEAIDTPQGAPLIDRLVAWTGRNPAWSR
jgi:uncharacterized protein (TIGR03086 family)